MIRGVFHSGEEIPEGTPHTTWRNATDGWLYIRIEGAMLSIAPRGRLQVSRADLARVPMIEAVLEGYELSGELEQSEPRPV